MSTSLKNAWGSHLCRCELPNRGWRNRLQAPHSVWHCWSEIFQQFRLFSSRDDDRPPREDASWLCLYEWWVQICKWVQYLIAFPSRFDCCANLAGIKIYDTFIVSGWKCSKGLAEYVLEKIEDAKTRGVVVGYDHRYNSERWAQLTATVFPSPGISHFQLTATYSSWKFW